MFHAPAGRSGRAILSNCELSFPNNSDVGLNLERRGRILTVPPPCRLKTCDTADYKSALRGSAEAPGGVAGTANL